MSHEKKPDRTVVLRDERTEFECRYVAATLQADGDLLIEGQDLGQSVALYFGEGNIEYEWYRLIPAAQVSIFKNALENNDSIYDEPFDTCSILVELKKYFTHHPLTNLDALLKKHNIEYKTWSRTGK